MLTCSGAAKCNGMNETKEEQNLDRASGGFSETAWFSLAGNFQMEDEKSQSEKAFETWG